MKAERVQSRARVVARARSFARWVCGVLARIEAVAGALKRVFGCSGMK